MRRSLLFLFCLLILSCSRKKTAQQQVLALKEMNDLTTVEYVVTKIIKTNDNQTWFKFGDRKILMSCQATIKAGIDFTALHEENIRINGKEITIDLPRAKLISLNIKPEDIRVEYEEVGLLRQHFDQAEKNNLMTQGEKQIRAGVDALGVLQTAETNGSVFITRFLRQLGYEKINIRFGNMQSIPTLN